LMLITLQRTIESDPSVVVSQNVSVSIHFFSGIVFGSGSRSGPLLCLGCRVVRFDVPGVHVVQSKNQILNSIIKELLKTYYF
jgi:hypothetical protein